MPTKDRRVKNVQKSLNRSAKGSNRMNTFFETTKNKQHEQDNEQQEPEDTDVPGPSSAKRPTLSSTDDDDVLNESTETVASNTSLYEGHDCSLELDDTDNTADQNENSDDDDAQEDSSNEIYVPPAPGFASPDDVALENRLYDERKYLKQHTWRYYSHNKGDTSARCVKLFMVTGHVQIIDPEEHGVIMKSS